MWAVWGISVMKYEYDRSSYFPNAVTLCCPSPFPAVASFNVAPVQFHNLPVTAIVIYSHSGEIWFHALWNVDFILDLHLFWSLSHTSRASVPGTLEGWCWKDCCSLLMLTHLAPSLFHWWRDGEEAEVGRKEELPCYTVDAHCKQADRSETRPASQLSVVHSLLFSLPTPEFSCQKLNCFWIHLTLLISECLLCARHSNTKSAC